ncbi:MAG: substrate-binding domain-containing protein [Lautropia sp.]
MAIRVISSMATKQLLAALAAAIGRESGVGLEIESVGGVDAAKRVAAGEAFDVVVLAADAIDALIAEGHVVAGSRTDLVRSGVSVAVPAGDPHPPIADEGQVRRALREAPSIGYSTGPSGRKLLERIAQWGLADELADRLVLAPPGVPVAALLAQRKVAIGVQQLSELMNVDRVDVVGPLPDAISIVTVFSAGLVRASTQPDAARAAISSLAGPLLVAAAPTHGMEKA